MLKKIESSDSHEEELSFITKSLSNISEINQYRETISSISHISQGYVIDLMCSLIPHLNLKIRRNSVKFIG